MVICFIALPVLAVLGIFSAKYRILAKEAFHCIFNTVRLRPCDTGFDQRIKSKLTAKTMRWPKLAKFLYKNFALLSWIFVILMILSTFFSARGVYYLIVYNNCNGPNGGYCPITGTNAVTAQQKEHEGTCSAGVTTEKLFPDKINLFGYPVRGKSNARLTLVEYGCYSCPYTKKAEPIVRRILDENPDVSLVYHDVPLGIHPYSVESSEAALCAKEQGKYWEYHDAVFDSNEQLNNASLMMFARDIGLNTTQFEECFRTRKYQSQVDASAQNALAVGIYGTPTFFVHNVSIVSPNDLYSELKNTIKKEMPK